MLVIAHPDDESMFFIPFVSSCVKQGKKVSILCLSKGIESGLVRYNELLSAAKILNVTNVSIPSIKNGSYCADKNEDLFPDGMDQKWRSDDIIKTVEEYIQLWDIDTLITFDQNGVSGHPNHISTYHGIRNYSEKLIQQTKTKLPNFDAITFTENRNISLPHSAILDFCFLESTPLPLKYTSWFAGIYYNFIRSDRKQMLFYNSNFSLAWNAMKAHDSQLVWFRKIFLTFSSFVYVNNVTYISAPVFNNK